MQQHHITDIAHEATKHRPWTSKATPTHPRQHSQNQGTMEATDRGLLSLDVDSDLERSDARESQRAEQANNRSRRRDSSRQLSFSIQGFRSFDTSLMDEDEIPTRDAGLDLSFSNNAGRSVHLQDDVAQTRSCSSPDDREQTSGVGRRRRSSKKKRVKGKRGRGETEGSKNNNSLNYREKLECFEKGDFSGQEEVRFLFCFSLSLSPPPPPPPPFLFFFFFIFFFFFTFVVVLLC